MTTTDRRACLGALLALALGACGGADAPPAPPPPPAATLDGLALGASRTFATVGVPAQLTVTGHWSDGSAAPLTSGVTWTSSDEAVATVDAAGLIMPWASGAARVTASHPASGFSATVDVVARQVVPLRAGHALPASGSVDTGTVLYRVGGLVPGALYTPTLLGPSGDVDLAVYSDLSLGADALLCESFLVGTAADACSAPATAAGELWIEVNGEWTPGGATFGLDVPLARPMAFAMMLTFPAGVPYTGTVGPTKQFLKVAGLAPGAPYEVKVANLTADLDVEVYADPYVYRSLCESFLTGTADDACTARATPAGELFVEIDGQTTLAGGSYTLSVTAR